MSLTPTVVEKLTQPDGGSPEARAIRRGRALTELLRVQHGVVARRQLVTLGLNRGAIDWRIRSGRLHRVHRGVYAVKPGGLSHRGRWLAAVLASGEGAVLSHRSAGALWGLVGQRTLVEVTSVHGRPGRRGIELHRATVETGEQTVRDGIPTTTVARTLLDLAQVLDAARVRRVWEEADRLRMLELRAVAAACDRAGNRKGSRAIRLLLEEASQTTRTRSPLEDRFAAFCREQGLSAPATNVLLLGHEVDAFWPSARLVVELDSVEFHMHRAAFERDRARDAALQAAGYRIVRVTDRRLRQEPSRLAGELRRLLGGI